MQTVKAVGLLWTETYNSWEDLQHKRHVNEQQQQKLYLLTAGEELLGQKDREVDVTGISVLLSNIQLPVLKFACKIYHHLLGK